MNSNDQIIDLTPNKFSNANDSDVEIIEPEPPTIIDLASEETYSCNALTPVNASVSNGNETVSSDSSVNSGVSLIADTPENSEIVEISIETPKVIEIDQSITEPVPLYIRDSTGGGSLTPPLYDIVSDDSFCFDSPYISPLPSQHLSQDRTLIPDDSVIFVSETKKTPKKLRSQEEEYISINYRGGFNPLVRIFQLCLFEIVQ